MKRLLVGFAVATVLAVVLASSGCGSKRDNTGSKEYSDVNNPRLYFNMLVVCARTEEVQAFETKRVKYAYNRIAYANYSMLASKKDGKAVFVVTADKLESVPAQNYGLIQLKGHTNDMSALIEAVRNIPGLVKENQTVLLLGGCQTSQFVEVAGKLKAIPIATKQVGQSAHNDYLTLQLHSALAHTSLKGALDAIRVEAPATYEQYELPKIN